MVPPLADRVAAVPLRPASEVALQPHAPLRLLAAQAAVVPAARGRRVAVLMLATARRVPGRWVLARRAHQVPGRWVLARRAHRVPGCSALARRAHRVPRRRRCQAPQPPGRRQLASLVAVPGVVEAPAVAQVPAVADLRAPECPALRDYPPAEQEPRVLQVATGMLHLAEESLPET